ncbi:molybdopterin-dependent oxidoreductase [Streptomyces sp. WM6378]|uniref:molybdopterin-dependent oxidoreductase n=1 Tax=Streptomyces sp. WM6378 TaxID=1415557 RepID=UPI0006AF149E|nr:molybdopterin-dependent oxidoreductase [Streptomyces sp. WM6378]KOU39392.1 molybdopterin-dependent oxidoreductase [Streptomyces sp. WM6378]
MTHKRVADRHMAVVGAVDRPVRLSVAELRERWAQRTAAVTFDCATSGPRAHTFTGPLLREVITAAGPGFNPARRKDRSRFLLEVTGEDGHATVLSWAEIDEDFGDSPVLLATALDGVQLDALGAQLVVPSDRCGARYISGITQIRLRACGGAGEEADQLAYGEGGAIGRPV